ncbi:YdeI/OmpD-associated family protein [Limimaricola sp.]|uniref:YdeI/OmpD-associated family protein n=1 Tax=Limimaricola sp. TaxID=2211665 RepID=UPI00405860E7
MITEIETFFAKGCGRCARFDTPECSVRGWSHGLNELRRICLGAGLVETVKWGHPCYMHAGRNIVLLGAFRRDFRISFFNAALLDDPQGLLRASGPNSRHPDMISFADNTGPRDLEPAIRSLLSEAMAHAEAGRKPPRTRVEFELPDELVDALDRDPELATAFHALTPGRQRSYVININAAKKSLTRASRVAGFRERILAGKGAQERWSGA